MLIIGRPNHCVKFIFTAKKSDVHLVAYLLQSNIMASEFGPTLPTLDVALAQLKEFLHVKCIKMHMKLIRKERILNLKEKRRKRWQCWKKKSPLKCLKPYAG